MQDTVDIEVNKTENYLHFTKPHDEKRFSEDTWCRFAEEMN